MNDCYFIAKGKHLVVPVTKQEYEDYWNKKRNAMAKCPICGGTGDTTNNIPLTNEQKFLFLPTKEKAKFLLTWWKSYNKYNGHCDIDCCNQNSDRCEALQSLIKWLKSPYNGW